MLWQWISSYVPKATSVDLFYSSLMLKVWFLGLLKQKSFLVHDWEDNCYTAVLCAIILKTPQEGYYLEMVTHKNAILTQDYVLL